METAEEDGAGVEDEGTGGREDGDEDDGGADESAGGMGKTNEDIVVGVLNVNPWMLMAGEAVVTVSVSVEAVAVSAVAGALGTGTIIVSGALLSLSSSL